MKETNKKAYIIIAIIFIISLVLYICIPDKTYDTKHYKAVDRSLYALNYNDQVKQEFISDDNYEELGLPISNDGVFREDGKIFVEITNDKNQTKKHTINSSQLNDPNSFYFLKYKLKKDKKYIIVIYKNNTTTPISLFYTKAKQKNATMMINGDIQKGKNLLLSFKKRSINKFNIWYILLITNLVIVYFVLREKKYEE